MDEKFYKMKRKIFFLLLFLFCPVDLLAAELIESTAKATDLASSNPHFVIVRAEILELSSNFTSHENPTQAKIKILDVLRGRNKDVPWEAIARINPPHLNDMMIDPLNGNYEFKPEEKVRQYEMPEVGSQVLLAYCCVDNSNENDISTQTGLISWSEENEQIVRANMAKPEFRPITKIIIFLFFCIFTIYGYLSGALKINYRTLLIHRLGAFLGSSLLYMLYEAGFSTHSNIRIDLMFIYPIMFLNFAGLVWSPILFGVKWIKIKNA